MSYCVNCGVELEKGEKKCPLCDTEVINPNDLKNTAKESLFPAENIPERPFDNRKTVAPVAMLMLIPVFATMMCDIIITGKLSWSYYVIISVALIYVLVIPPVLSRKPRITIFTTIDFIATALFLYSLEKLTGEGGWFMGFALPLSACGFAIFGTDALLFTRLKLPKLIKTAIIFMSVGIVSVINELFLSKHFIQQIKFTWSLYVLIICAILTVVCLIFERNRKIKEKLKQKLFI